MTLLFATSIFKLITRVAYMFVNYVNAPAFRMDCSFIYIIHAYTSTTGFFARMLLPA